ncbi:MAG: CbtA family protein [Alphaproteobacteria bacterium]|nr:CbtA family protein [Alphaproteobacteria bacterium]
MFRKLFGAAFAAGIIAGLLITGVQQVTTTPLILHAEEYENGGHDHAAASRSDYIIIQTKVFSTLPEKLILAHSSSGTAGHDHADDEGQDHDDHAWAPEDGLERTLYTVGANIAMGIAFALMLTAAFAVHGGEMDGRRGILWAMGGFAMFTLGPNLGLPPEVPGSMAAELGARQMWWLGCAAATGIGLCLMVFGRKISLVVLGILILIAPHVIGAPQPETIGGSVPPELAGHFAAASIVVAAVFWAMLGWLSGTFYKRFEA